MAKISIPTFLSNVTHFKKVLIGIVTLLAVSYSFAQKRPSRIGIRAGVYQPLLKYSNLPSDFTKPTQETGVYGGLQADVPISQKVSVRPEIIAVIYSTQSYSPSTFAWVISEDISQIQVPVLFCYRLGKVSIFAGP